MSGSTVGTSGFTPFMMKASVRMQHYIPFWALTHLPHIPSNTMVQCWVILGQRWPNIGPTSHVIWDQPPMPCTESQTAQCSEWSTVVQHSTNVTQVGALRYVIWALSGCPFVSCGFHIMFSLTYCQCQLPKDIGSTHRHPVILTRLPW